MTVRAACMVRARELLLHRSCARASAWRARGGCLSPHARTAALTQHWKDGTRALFIKWRLCAPRAVRYNRLRSGQTQSIWETTAVRCASYHDTVDRRAWYHRSPAARASQKGDGDATESDRLPIFPRHRSVGPQTEVGGRSRVAGRRVDEGPARPCFSSARGLLLCM